MYNYVSISFLLFEDGTSCNVLPYFVVVVAIVVFENRANKMSTGTSDRLLNFIPESADLKR